MLEIFNGASEQDFQPLSIVMLASAHMEAMTLFATYAKGDDDAAVKEFAMKTLPKLEMNKMHVTKLVAPNWPVSQSPVAWPGCVSRDYRAALDFNPNRDGL